MASLARCIAKAGKNVSRHDTADLMDAYERARKQGYGERDAGIVAASQVLDDAAAEVAAVSEAIRDAGVDAGVTVARGEPVAVAKLDADGARRDRVVAVAERAWGKKLIRSLVERGVLSFVTAEDVAALGIKGLGTAEAVRENGIKGLVTGGKAYVVTDVVADKDVAGIVLHEVGVHYGLERMVGPKAFRALLYDLSRLRGKDAAVGKAYDAAERAGTAEDQMDEEALGRFAQANPSHALVERLLAAVRRFLRQLGVPASILSGDTKRLVDMAVDAMRAAGGTVVSKGGAFGPVGETAAGAGAGPDAAAETKFSRDQATFDPANPDIRYSRDGTPAPTSTKNRITEAERESEKRDPILKEMAQSNAETLDAAFDALAARPTLGRETVQRLKTSGTGGISLMDEAVLLIEKVRLRNARADASDRAAAPDATEEQVTTALTDWHNAEAMINDMDQATYQSGKEWGRLGQFRQRMMRADYTFEAMESRERVTRGRALTVDESADVKQVAERVAAAEKEAVRAATEQADAEADAGVTHTVEAIKKDVAKKPPVAPPPPADVLRDIDPADITHKDVYDLARAHILAGTHGESKVMAAVTKDLQTLDASITERQVRRLFSEYGKVTFPSAEADKVELRELRTLVRLQESITRMIEGRDALHTGPQRDKATQAIREKQHQLNDLLKERERNSAPSPEKLAGYQEARARNLRNQIEDLEREIETGEQRVVRPPPPPNDEVKALVAERDALRSKVRATVQATEKYKTEQEQKYLRAREADLTKQIEALDARIKGAPAKAAPGPKPVNAETLRLTAIRDALADELAAIEAAQKPQKSEEQKYQERRAKSIERQVKDILARIAAGDYAKRPRVDRELDAANTTAQFELAKIKASFARRQFEIEMENRTRLQKVFGVLPEAANLARAVMTSYDLSAVLRQGGFITLGHPVRAATSIMPMLRAMVSEEQQFKVHDEIAARDNFPLYKRAGLELTEHNTHLPSKLEEQFVSRWLDYTEPKGPLAKRLAIHGKNILLFPTRASGRAFVTFLNKLRADSFDAMVATLAKNGKTPTQEEIEAIANYINVATGRGRIGVKGKNPGTTMTTVFFAPRLVASRFNLLAGQPMYGGTLRTKALVLAEYARFLAGVGVVVGLGALAHSLGDDDDKPFIETDPRSTNFMKMRFGNTYVDPLAGLAQVTAFFAREATGETVTQKGDVAPLRTELRPLNAFRDVPNYDSPQWGRDTGASVLFRFVRTKFAPVPSAIVNILTGTNVIGEDTTIANEAVSLVTPLAFRDTKAIMTDNGIAAGTAIQLLNMLGMSVQYRKPYEKKPRKSKAPVEE